MENLKLEVLSFLEKKPEVLTIIGYGSGIKKQTNNHGEKQLDLILGVQDDLAWHRQNYQQYPQEYSKLGFHLLPFFHQLGTDINYLTGIHYQNQSFKLGIISQTKLMEDIGNWKNFYLAGRLQKPVEIIKTPNVKETNRVIETNRLNALRVALLLSEKEEMTIEELLEQICALSYVGDIRMQLKLEDPNKVKNIVSGNLEEFQQIYEPFISKYTSSTTTITCDQNKILSEIQDLPIHLLQYIKAHHINDSELTKKDLEEIKKLIKHFLQEQNLKTGCVQPIKGLLLNTKQKTLQYLIRKFKKGHQKGE